MTNYMLKFILETSPVSIWYQYVPSNISYDKDCIALSKSEYSSFSQTQIGFCPMKNDPYLYLQRRGHCFLALEVRMFHERGGENSRHCDGWPILVSFACWRRYKNCFLLDRSFFLMQVGGSRSCTKSCLCTIWREGKEEFASGKLWMRWATFKTCTIQFILTAGPDT